MSGVSWSVYTARVSDGLAAWWAWIRFRVGGSKLQEDLVSYLCDRLTFQLDSSMTAGTVGARLETRGIVFRNRRLASDYTYMSRNARCAFSCVEGRLLRVFIYLYKRVCGFIHLYI